MQLMQQLRNAMIEVAAAWSPSALGAASSQCSSWFSSGLRWVSLETPII